MAKFCQTRTTHADSKVIARHLGRIPLAWNQAIGALGPGSHASVTIYYIMLSAEDNAFITQTDRGTPMGELFRRFWLPVMLPEELPEPDCPPIRLKLLGEYLVAFRDSNGNVGLIEAFCPHRRAPLFYGRNEECGLRCVYHGWKFDVNGNCVDMPSEPQDSDFREKVSLQAYPTREWGGVIWAYMG